jgi:hypothetical protein
VGDCIHTFIPSGPRLTITLLAPLLVKRGPPYIKVFIQLHTYSGTNSVIVKRGPPYIKVCIQLHTYSGTNSVIVKCGPPYIKVFIQSPTYSGANSGSTLRHMNRIDYTAVLLDT